MTWVKHDYEDIPGTYVFDGKRSHSAYAVNKMLFSFNHQINRDEFHRDPEAYAIKFGVPDEQREALLAGDFLGLLRMGANIYFMAKLAVPSGVSVQDVGAQFQNITTEEFKANLAKNGEGLEEKLEKLGGYWNG